MNPHQIRCFYKEVTKDGRIRLIRIPMNRIKIATGTMGHIFWLIVGKPIDALRRAAPHYSENVRIKHDYSMTPEALAFIAREMVDHIRAKGLKVKTPSWRNISNDEAVLYVARNKEMEKNE